MHGAALLGDAGANLVDHAVHVDAVGHGPLARILHHQVAVEEAEGLLGWRGRQPDDEGIEVLQHLPPEGVDGAVAFVHDDDVEVLRRQVAAVDHLLGTLLRKLAVHLPQGAFFQLGVELGFAAQHGVEALDGGDADLAHGVEDVGAHVLDVVQLAELASIVGGDVLAELVVRLPAQIGAIHQEEHPLGPGVLDQAIGEGDGSEGLAAAGGHLDQRPRAVLGKGLLQLGDGLDLSSPQAVGDQGRKLLQASAQLLRALYPGAQRLWLVEGEQAAAAGIGIETVGEEGLHAGAFVEEGEGRVVVQGELAQAEAVPGRLRLDAAESGALRLGLDGADGLAIHEQQVVGEAGLQGKLAHGNAGGRAQVHLVAALYPPAGGFQQVINALSGLLFGLHQFPAATRAKRET